VKLKKEKDSVSGKRKSEGGLASEKRGYVGRENRRGGEYVVNGLKIKRRYHQGGEAGTAPPAPQKRQGKRLCLGKLKTNGGGKLRGGKGTDGGGRVQNTSMAQEGKEIKLLGKQGWNWGWCGRTAST